MPGALGIVCANGGNVMRIAFRRVQLSRLLCALTLVHFSAYNRPSISFLLAYHV